MRDVFSSEINGFFRDLHARAGFGFTIDGLGLSSLVLLLVSIIAR